MRDDPRANDPVRVALNGVTVAQAVTDANGKFAVGSLAAGSCQVSADAVDPTIADPTTVTVSIQSGKTTTVTITVDPGIV